MNDTPEEKDEGRRPVGTLVDLVTGAEDDNPLGVEIVLDDRGRVMVFYDKKFTQGLSWFEYDLGENRLDFVMEDGQSRSAGVPMPEKLSKNMQNTHQILTIFMDDKTGEAVKGQYIPLIIHRS